MRASRLIPLSDRPPLWREARFGLEAAALLRDPIFRGDGITDGRGRPVLLIPGFLAGDGSLSMMAGWLKRTGYRPRRAGSEGGDRRPEPRWHPRQGACPPPAGPHRRRRGARLAADRPARGASAR